MNYTLNLTKKELVNLLLKAYSFAGEYDIYSCHEGLIDLENGTATLQSPTEDTIDISLEGARIFDGNTLAVNNPVNNEVYRFTVLKAIEPSDLHNLLN